MIHLGVVQADGAVLHNGLEACVVQADGAVLHNGLKACVVQADGAVQDFTKGIYWEAGLFLRTPFTEGCAGANEKASPPGRQQRCIFSLLVYFRPCNRSVVH